MKIPSIFLIGKKKDSFCEKACLFIKQHFPEHQIVLLERGQKLEEANYWWRGDYVISYLAPIVVPETILKRAKKAAINFHPAPPEYPGIGCTNFALYNEEKIYGITCHYMAAKVDSGDIISVKRFPILDQDTVYFVTQRCYVYLLSMFYDIMSIIYKEKSLPISSEKWTRKPYKRSQLNKLCELTPDMPVEEIRKRVRATVYPGAPGAFIEIDGMKFPYVEGYCPLKGVKNV